MEKKKKKIPKPRNLLLFCQPCKGYSLVSTSRLLARTLQPSQLLHRPYLTSLYLTSPHCTSHLSTPHLSTHLNSSPLLSLYFTALHSNSHSSTSHLTSPLTSTVLLFTAQCYVRCGMSCRSLSYIRASPHPQCIQSPVDIAARTHVPLHLPLHCPHGRET